MTIPAKVACFTLPMSGHWALPNKDGRPVTDHGLIGLVQANDQRFVRQRANIRRARSRRHPALRQNVSPAFRPRATEPAAQLPRLISVVAASDQLRAISSIA